MKTCKILFRHPDANVRALQPKILTWEDHKKERHHFEPTTQGGKVVYEVSEEYARILLGNQPERYFLLEPKKLLVKFRSTDALSSQMREVGSVLGTAKFREFEATAATEQKVKDAAAKADEPKDPTAEELAAAAAKVPPKPVHVPPAPQGNDPGYTPSVPVNNGPKAPPGADNAL